MHSSCNHWMHELFVHQLAFNFIHCKWNSLINISFHGWNLFISTCSFKMYEFHPSFIFLPEAWIAPLSFTHNEYLKSCATTYKVPCAIVSLMEACMITMYKNTGIFFLTFPSGKVCNPLMENSCISTKKWRNLKAEGMGALSHCQTNGFMFAHDRNSRFCGSSNKDQKRDSNEITENAIY